MWLANLTLRLVLEALALVALGVWGARVDSTATVRMVLAVGMPLLAVVLWGVYVVPSAPRRLADPARLLLEVALFAVAGLALAGLGLPLLGESFGVVAVVNALLVRVGERERSGRGERAMRR